MPKNAYEIRLDTLHLARDILSENAESTGVDVTDAAIGIRTKNPFTVEEVVKKAEILYAFIEKGKEQK